MTNPTSTHASRRLAVAGCLYFASVIVAIGLHATLGRPFVAGPGQEIVSEWLSLLMGRDLLPRQIPVAADRVVLGSLLLSSFIFGIGLHGARLVSRRVVVLLLLLIGAGIRIHIAVGDPVLMRRWPLDDDSHYYFNIAYNLAHGCGLRHDSVNVTTGVQPLFLLLITPVYWLFESKTLAINAILFLQTALGAGLALALHFLTRRLAGDTAALFVLAVWAFSNFFVSLDLNGLETGLSLICICGVSLAYLHLLDGPGAPNARARIAFGALLGVAFLARNDTGLLSVAVGLHWILANPFRQSLSERAAAVAIVAAVAGLFALPWLAVNVALVGSPLPSGGQAVRFLSLAYGYRIMRAIGPAFDPTSIPFEYYDATARFALTEIRELVSRSVEPRPALLIAAIGFAAALRPALRSLRRLDFFLGFLLLLLLAYTLYIFGQWYFYRYLAPFAVGYLLVLACCVWGAIEKRMPDRSSPGRRALEVALAAGLAFTLLPDVVSVTSPRNRRARGFYEAAQWINRHTPENAVIGAFQSGIFGYYLERRFYGLDGKINFHALRALEDERIDEYVREARIEYLVDWPVILRDLFTARARDRSLLSRQEPIYRNGEVAVYHLEAAPTQNTNDSAKPDCR